MKQVEITITIPKAQWLQALVDGWKDRFNEELPIQDIKGLGQPDEVPYAIANLDLDENNIEIMEFDT